MSFFSGLGIPRRSFDPGATNFDQDNAWWLSKFSQLAYENKSRIAFELESINFSQVTFVDFSGSQGYLAVSPPTSQAPRGFAVLAFRGTENDWKDILTDITTVKTKLTDEDYRAHAGFVYALNDVWGTGLGVLQTTKIRTDWYGSKGISDALDALNPPDEPPQIPVFFTGHSLGAALATLAAHYRLPKALYTYGSPRVVESKLAKVYERRRLPTYRIVNSTDIVARVPFSLMGFRHVGELIYLTRSGKVLRGRSAWFWFCVASLQTWILPLIAVTPYALIAALAPGLFTNHRIGAYVSKL